MAADNLLLLPGMMCGARMWQAQIDNLDVPTSIPLCDEFDNFADAATANSSLSTIAVISP